MTNFLILHGTGASPEANWFIWLKGKLIGKGHKVWLPQLPDSDKPSTSKYNAFILSNEDFEINSDTIIVGHSSGAVEILSLLENLPEPTIIRAAIMVSAFKDDLGWSVLEELFLEPFDYRYIKSRCKQFVLIHSDNDPYVPQEHAMYLSEKLEGRLVVMEGQGHFNTEQSSSYKQFPELLEIITAITADD